MNWQRGWPSIVPAREKLMAIRMNRTEGCLLPRGSYAHT